MKSLVDTIKNRTGAADNFAAPGESALGGRSQIKFRNDRQLLVDEVAVQTVKGQMRGIPGYFHLEVGNCDAANLRVADLDFSGVGAEDVSKREFSLVEHDSFDDAVLHRAWHCGKKIRIDHDGLLFQLS